MSRGNLLEYSKKDRAYKIKLQKLISKLLFPSSNSFKNDFKLEIIDNVIGFSEKIPNVNIWELHPVVYDPISGDTHYKIKYSWNNGDDEAIVRITIKANTNNYNFKQKPPILFGDTIAKDQSHIISFDLQYRSNTQDKTVNIDFSNLKHDVNDTTWNLWWLKQYKYILIEIASELCVLNEEYRTLHPSDKLLVRTTNERTFELNPESPFTSELTTALNLTYPILVSERYHYIDPNINVQEYKIRFASGGTNVGHKNKITDVLIQTEFDFTGESRFNMNAKNTFITDKPTVISLFHKDKTLVKNQKIDKKLVPIFLEIGTNLYWENAEMYQYIDSINTQYATGKRFRSRSEEDIISSLVNGATDSFKFYFLKSFGLQMTTKKKYTVLESHTVLDPKLTYNLLDDDKQAIEVHINYDKNTNVEHKSQSYKLYLNLPDDSKHDPLNKSSRLTVDVVDAATDEDVHIKWPPLLARIVWMFYVSAKYEQNSKSVGGMNKKAAGKVRRVKEERGDSKKRYVVMDKKKVFLSSIRGKYRYVDAERTKIEIKKLMKGRSESGKKMKKSKKNTK